MIDVSKTIQPKSDQLNADDLVGGAKTIRIRDIKGFEDEAQPIAIYFDGDNNKPYKPCKSMRRVLVQLWGIDGTKYIGKSLTLYRDDTVKFGGVEVGGIRISHASGIDKPTKVLLTIARSKRKPFTIEPIVVKAKTLTPERFEKALIALKDGKTTKENIESYELTDGQKTELQIFLETL